ncbi:MAG: hypothetical protein JWN76_3383 [Chitinophagaceae bacterium]|nr:hypothetical protein [Chitinophagaceae bacterium]
MSDHLQSLNIHIKKEADEILYKKGLIDILNSFGTPHIHGSYLLDLMTWRDLDIYLEVDNIAESDFFLLGGKICTVLKPVKMSFRNETISKTQNLPFGLYWGIYLGNERAGAWKIDIWTVGTSECERLIDYCKEIKQQLTSLAVSRILEIKSQCWTDPEYRRSYSSSDIYTAVLEKNIPNIGEFKKYLRTTK